MYSIICISEDDMKGGFESFTIIHEFDTLDEALLAFNRANADLEVAIAVGVTFNGRLLDLIVCNDTSLEGYLRDFSETFNDNIKQGL